MEQRIVIVSGHPTDIEVAAITAALERHRSTAQGDQTVIQPRWMPATGHRVSRWARAARLEGCGHPPIDSPAGITR
jgi:hypothetical protein